MVLCFGTFANVLMACALPGTTNRQMVSTLVGTIDPDNKYGDKNNDTPVSRLMNCTSDFPTVQVLPSDGPIRSNGGSLTNVVALAKEITPDELAEKFRAVSDLIDEDKKNALVGALDYLIKNDESLADKHQALFSKCVRTDEKDFNHYLSGIFLYTILNNDNKSGKEYLKQIKNKNFIEKFYDFETGLIGSESIADSLCEGAEKYMRHLKEKYDRIPSFLYKEALHPFRKYYVPNDVIWHIPNPEKKYAYRVERMHDVTTDKLFHKISTNIVISGTGGLGKSMMMRNLLLSSIKDFNKNPSIPFFIPLKDYDLSYGSIFSFIFAIVHNMWPELTEEKLEDIFDRGRAILLFDGLDEIRTGILGEFTKEMNGFLDRYPENSTVLSSRPYSNFVSFSRSTVLYLQPLTKTQALDLVDRYNYWSETPERQIRFRSLLENELYESHKGFSDNPLLLSIMMMTFEMDAEVPNEAYVFYQEAYMVLSRRHDAMKEGYKRELETGWNTTKFADYFAFFCAVSYSDGKVSFTFNDMDQYYRMMSKKYPEIGSTTVDDFIYDLTNNLCLMYQDGTNYSFIHRSFQEYFCAKYFNSQLDELLTEVIPIFDRDDTTKRGDKTLSMLYAMKAPAVEKYLIVPYLRGLIDDCNEKDGIWTFLNRIYPDYEMTDGDAEAEEDNCAPHSNLYGFIIDHYNVPLLSPNANDFPGVDNYTRDTMVYREDTYEDVWSSDLPSSYEDIYGIPEVTGRLYVIDWKEAHEDCINYPQSMTGFKMAVESPAKPFMKEYNTIKELLKSLEEKTSRKSKTRNIFDLMA